MHIILSRTATDDFDFLFVGAMLIPDIWLLRMSESAADLALDQTSWYIYAAMVGGVFMLSIMRACFFFATTLRSSERMHQKMTASVLQAPVAFFDCNPGVLNRFSKDIGCMDELLPSIFLAAIQMVLFAISSFLLPVVLNPFAIVFGAPLVALFIIFWGYYLKAARQVRKLEISCRRPVVSHFSETLSGLLTIRTHEMQRTFIADFHGLVGFLVSEIYLIKIHTNDTHLVFGFFSQHLRPAYSPLNESTFFSEIK